MRKWCLLVLTALAFDTLQSQERYDVVISELMADPSPVVGLPAVEWIELKNTSLLPINLTNWRMGDASSLSSPFPAYILAPDSFVIICTGSAVSALSGYGRTLAVTSFPSLDNDGDEIFIRNAAGKIIHGIRYHTGWYENEMKKAGGWSLEMIDPLRACAGAGNWISSKDGRGGTPGRVNASNAIYIDDKPPRLLHAYMEDTVNIVLEFDEPVDSLQGATLTNYTIDGSMMLVAATSLAPLFQKVRLRAAQPLVVGHIYLVTANHVADCENNTISPGSTARVGRPTIPVNGELLINEILFNPRPGGYDYVEILNNSEAIFDAAHLFIANRNTSGVISSIQPVSELPRYLFPGDYLVVTEHADNLALQYHVKDPQTVFPINSMPSFADDEGDVVLLNQLGVVVDEVNYKDDWHFKLITNAEGVSLERLDGDGISSEAGSWHSAASTAGYGTPGYGNSQSRSSFAVAGAITVSPQVFSPDNDGREDVLTIHYQLSQVGYTGNLKIYDLSGRTVRHLVRNDLMGARGTWTWDGLDDRNARLPLGYYLLLTEIFNLAGKTERFRNTVVLARPLR